MADPVRVLPSATFGCSATLTAGLLPTRLQAPSVIMPYHMICPPHPSPSPEPLTGEGPQIKLFCTCLPPLLPSICPWVVCATLPALTPPLSPCSPSPSLQQPSSQPPRACFWSSVVWGPCQGGRSCLPIPLPTSRAGGGWKIVWRGGVFGRQNKRNHPPAPSGTQSPGAKN